MANKTNRTPGPFTQDINDSYPKTGPIGTAGEQRVMRFIADNPDIGTAVHYPDDRHMQVVEGVDIVVTTPSGREFRVDVKANESKLQTGFMRLDPEAMRTAVTKTPEIIWWWVDLNSDNMVTFQVSGVLDILDQYPNFATPVEYADSNNILISLDDLSEHPLAFACIGF